MPGQPGVHLEGGRRWKKPLFSHTMAALAFSPPSAPSQVDFLRKEHWIGSLGSATTRLGLSSGRSSRLCNLWLTAVTEVKVHEKAPRSPLQAG